MNQIFFYKSKNLKYHLVANLCAVVMTVISVYLTVNFFELSKGFVGNSLCDVNSYLNCSIISGSKSSTIMGMPISIFGILMGLYFFLGYFFSSTIWEKTYHGVLTLNAILCVILFFYSAFFLRGLCPGCVIYYLGSWALFLTFKKAGLTLFFPDWRVISSYGILAIITFGSLYGHFEKKNRDHHQITQKMIRQFKSSPQIPHPKPSSPYRIASAAENFEDAPIRISEFSDFQCPACKKYSKTLHELAKKYRGKITIESFFLPFDNACNPVIKRKFHEFACEAAYLAASFPENFAQVEKDIFENQKNLSFKWISNYAQKHQVFEQMKQPQIKQIVSSHIEHANRLNIKVIPTILLNGVRMKGTFSISELSILIDHILSKEN